MSSDAVLRCFFLLLIAGFLGYSVFRRDELDRTPEADTANRYPPFFATLILPFFLAWLLVGCLVAPERGYCLRRFFAMLALITVHLSLYQLLLLALRPLLERFLSARACAVLWLLPNFLYFTQQSWCLPDVPRWIIILPAWAPAVLGAVWAAGFLAVLGQKILVHLSYRRRILHNAVPVSDRAVLEIFDVERQNAGRKTPKYRLVISPAVKTPLSIGFFQRSIRVVLPRLNYSAEELHLIFRHELVHLGRGDSVNKFYLAFCTALGWFNPLMWMAMARGADDLELSCDETVLLDADAQTRRTYASLLLRTAEEGRGFTTCLSVSGNLLRRRLRRVTSDGWQYAGGLVVAVLLFLLCASTGFVALGRACGTGAEVIFGGDVEAYTLTEVRYSENPYSMERTCADPDAFTAYLASLPLEEALWDVSYESPYYFDATYHSEEGTVVVEIVEGYLRVIPFSGNLSSHYYRVEVDESYLASLLT